MTADDPTDSPPRDSRLSRWSRRKLESQQPATEPVAVDYSEPPVEADGGAQHAELTDADMPSLETLNSDSDYSPFLSPKVSEDLRRQALRKLFHFPEFNVTDGLNDYDEDYTTFPSLGKMITHEMRRALLREAQRQEQQFETTASRGEPATTNTLDTSHMSANNKETRVSGSDEDATDEG